MAIQNNMVGQANSGSESPGLRKTSTKQNIFPPLELAIMQCVLCGQVIFGGCTEKPCQPS